MPLSCPFDESLQALVERAAAGPCQKSKRAAMLVAEGYLDIAVNEPACAPGERGVCDGSAACRLSCAEICNHAEEAVLLKALRSAPLERAHMIHVAVDEHGRPRDKAVPGCVRCSRLMLRAGVEHVWLWGGDPMRWQVWTAADFHAATLKNLRLHDRRAPAPVQREHLKLYEIHSKKLTWRARFAGEPVACGASKEEAATRALELLHRAGVTAQMSGEDALRLLRDLDKRELERPR